MGFLKENHEIKIQNRQGVELKGYYLKNQKPACVLAFAGFCGTCDKMFCKIIEEAEKAGLDFLFANTTASYERKIIKKHCQDGSITKVESGGCFENYRETIRDMKCWLEFLKDYKTIYLIGASLACNRIVKFLNLYSCPNLKKLVLICPQDLKSQADKNLLDEARRKCEREILSGKVFGEFEISAKTYLDLFDNDDLDNLAYFSKSQLKDLQNIKIPIFSIIGSDDQGLKGLDAKKAMAVLQNNSKNMKTAVIDGATHSFRNFEQELAEEIVKFLKGEEQ